MKRNNNLGRTERKNIERKEANRVNRKYGKKLLIKTEEES